MVPFVSRHVDQLFAVQKQQKNGFHFILRRDWRKIAAVKGFLVNLDEICRTDRNNCKCSIYLI